MRLDTVEKRMEYRAAMVPKGALKVKPKGTAVEVFLYDRLGMNSGRPYGAAAFKGTAGKPLWRYGFKTEAQRNLWVADQIKGWQEQAQRHKAQGLDRMKPHGLEVGHILVTCWGYDQTNREFYQVVEVPGPRTVILQELASVSAGETGWMQGNVVPSDKPKDGKAPIKCVAHYGTVKPDGHYASLWDGKPVDWTGYA